MTNEEIKTLADGYYAGNADWLNKEQEQDTKVGWRQGFAYALRQFAVSGSLPLDVIKEAKYLLLIDGEGFCKEWKEGIGDCKKPSCIFCRKQMLIEILERQ